MTLEWARAWGGRRLHLQSILVPHCSPEAAAAAEAAEGPAQWTTIYTGALPRAEVRVERHAREG